MVSYCFAAAIVLSVFAGAFAQDFASRCLEVRDRSNQKDLYADPTDCHFYVQCFYYNATFASGVRRTCPAGSFFHEPVLSCMPEGSTPCVDQCLNDDVAARGCYAGFGCRSFYICANTGSYGMCCPSGTQFNSNNCACEASETCSDSCVMQAPVVATTVAPPEAVNATVCQDSFGSFIAADANQANGYHLIDSEGQSSGLQFCVDGFAFNLESCRCDIETGVTVPVPTGLRRATLYLNFDADTSDSSVMNFATFLYNGAQRVTTTSAFGAGSLDVNGGRMEVPAFKTYDWRSEASWCAFYRCTDASCPNAGGIIANAMDVNGQGRTLVLGVTAAQVLTGNVQLQAPQGATSVSGGISTPANGWNQACLTYDGNTASLYMNGALAQSTNVGGYLYMSHAPLAIGNDQGLGNFNGWIDEVLVTSFAMTSEEIQAHYSGDRAFLQSQGFW